jgi:hypothetical protein
MRAGHTGSPDRSPGILAACLAALCALGGVSLSTSPLMGASSPFGAGLPRTRPAAVMVDLLHPGALAGSGSSLAPGCVKLVPDGPSMHDLHVRVAAIRAAYPEAPLTFTERAVRGGASYYLDGVLVCPW